ncbi:MAG: hypothetical protein HY293_05915 [Planctomycetes bacterium]|nr:hypothetical protein [Planctomycetota bacterium]
MKPPPRPVAIPSRSLNPWGDTEPGTWYRLKTSRLGKDSYTDIGLKEKGKDFVVLVTQTCADGQASAVSEAKSSPSVVYLLGEQSFSFEGRSFLCEVQSPATDDASPKTWSLISGKNLGAVLKAISPEGTLTAKRVWDHAWRVKYTMLDCLVVEGQLESGGASRAVKSWYCSSVPLGLVRQEKPGESMTLVDLGGDWAKRPAFPK